MNREEKDVLSESRSRSGIELAREVAGGLDGWGWGSIKRGLKSSVTAPFKAVKYSFTAPYQATKAYATNKPVRNLSNFTRFSGVDAEISGMGEVTLEQISSLPPASRAKVQQALAAGRLRLA